MIDLSGKIFLVTGTTRGIGKAIKQVCEAQGARVIPHASRPHAETDDSYIYEDLSQSGAGKRVFETALTRHGRIDGVVNNAGIFLPSPLKGAGWDAGWSTTLAVNVTAPADICRAAISHFRETGSGSIVNIASRAGHRGDGIDNAAYAASKGALLAMTKTWARALSGEDILIYAIAPGWVETRMAPQDIENRKKAVADIPLGRVAQPEEIANMTAFLLSGACPSAVGATMDINGASYVR